MQTVTQQEVASDDDRAADAAMPTRPEPLVADRLATISEAVVSANADDHRSPVAVRAELAAAFRRLGRGAEAAAAFKSARDFYKSSGHRWTRDLR